MCQQCETKSRVELLKSVVDKVVDVTTDSYRSRDDRYKADVIFAYSVGGAQVIGHSIMKLLNDAMTHTDNRIDALRRAGELTLQVLEQQEKAILILQDAVKNLTEELDRLNEKENN